MSFTATVKNEISDIEQTEITNLAELSAIISCSYKTDTLLRISTEHSKVIRRIFNLLKTTFGITPKIIVRKGYNYNKNYIYILEITQNLDKIYETIGLKNDVLPEEYLLDDEESLRAYIRGVFLTTGSINDPKKSRYHLEFLFNSEEYAEFYCDLLNRFYLGSKYIKRENKYMVYIKEAEKIGDFLRIIHAISSLLYYEDIRIYRDHKNMTNRLNNCEQANVDKIIQTANQQLQDIELIEKYGDLELLDEKIKEVALYRKKYPEASLLELSEIISYETGIPITKSGLNHRLKKIKDFASKIRKQKEEA